LTAKEARKKGLLDPSINIPRQESMNRRFRPGQVTQMVFIDSEYRGICVKTDKLWQVIKKFEKFINIKSTKTN